MTRFRDVSELELQAGWPYLCRQILLVAATPPVYIQLSCNFQDMFITV